MRRFLFLIAGVAAAGLTAVAAVSEAEADFAVIDLEAPGFPTTYVKGGTAESFAADPAYKTTKIVLKRVKAGTFWMGEGENGDVTASANRHRVRLTRDFWFGLFPVTQRQYELVTGSNPSEFTSASDAAQHPVERVNWYHLEAADGFLAKLGGGWGLPTEAQWEYACRAGTTTSYFWGNDPGLMSAYGWCTNVSTHVWKGPNAFAGTQAVGLKKPNSWGFYDLYGNVSEWCADLKGAYPTNALTVDPTGPVTGRRLKVCRGGVWNFNTSGWRGDYRSGDPRLSHVMNCGFRLARAIVPSQTDARRYRRIVVETAGLPQGKAFLADIVTRRVTERSAVAVGAGDGAYRVRFRPDAALAEDAYALTMSDGVAEIAARNFRGFAYGAGAFLRTISYEADAFCAGRFRQTDAPRYAVRCGYLPRHFGNYYEQAPGDEQRLLYEDLLLWGLNELGTFTLSCEQLDFDTNSAAFKADIAAYRRVRRDSRDLDLRLTALGLFGNPTFNDAPLSIRAEALANPHLNPGVRVCPAKPGARDWLVRTVDAVNAAIGREDFPDVYGLFPYDEGGCTCSACAPWGGKGFLDTCEILMGRVRAFSPGTKFLLAGWLFFDDEWELYAERVKKGFKVDALMSDSHGLEVPRYPLEHDLGAPVVTFPEISMWGRYPWGGTGAQPLPKRMRRIFEQVKGRVAGCVYYSEGPYEDVNKILVQRFYWDDAPVHETLAAYARFYFPGVRTDDFLRLSALLEDNQECLDKPTPAARRRADEAVALVRKMDGEILPSMRMSARWRMMLIRAELDALFLETKDWSAPRSQELLGELVRLYHMEKVSPEAFSATRPPVEEGECRQ